MPFFTETHWMQNLGKVWVWIALTVPSTALSFTFFIMWSRKDMERKRAADDEEMVLFRSPNTATNSDSDGGAALGGE